MQFTLCGAEFFALFSGIAINGDDGDFVVQGQPVSEIEKLPFR